jgi:hypothetical protein
VTDDLTPGIDAANRMGQYFTCETHPWLLWSGLHIPTEGPTCPDGCAGPGQPIGLSLRRLHDLERRLERPVPDPPDPDAVLVNGDDLTVRVLGTVLLPHEGDRVDWARALLWPAGLCVDDAGTMEQHDDSIDDPFRGDDPYSLMRIMPPMRPRITITAYALHPAGTRGCCRDYEPRRGVSDA